MGAYRDEAFNEYWQASPSLIVTENSPAFFLYHGIEDRLVEHAQAAAFEARLKEKKVEVQRHSVTFLGHANTFIFSEEAVEKALAFLDRKLKN